MLKKKGDVEGVYLSSENIVFVQHAIQHVRLSNLCIGVTHLLLLETKTTQCIKEDKL